jgi:hypothetical protein
MGMGMRIAWPCLLDLLAGAYGRAGQTEEALDVLAEALARMEETEESFYEAELHRLQGKLLRMQGEAEDEEVDACFPRALEVSIGDLSCCRLYCVGDRQYAHRTRMSMCLISLIRTTRHTPRISASVPPIMAIALMV